MAGGAARGRRRVARRLARVRPFEPAFHAVGRWIASGYFLGGVAAFGGVDILVDRWMDDESKENGWGLWASVTTDGVPENAAMGSLLVGDVHGATAFPFVLVVTDGSQSMTSATDMTGNHGEWETLAAWVAIGVVVGASVMASYRYPPSLPQYWLGALRAFAGGAILASLAGEISPDAYE